MSEPERITVEGIEALCREATLLHAKLLGDRDRVQSDIEPLPHDKAAERVRAFVESAEHQAELKRAVLLSAAMSGYAVSWSRSAVEERFRAGLIGREARRGELRAARSLRQAHGLYLKAFDVWHFFRINKQESTAGEPGRGDHNGGSDGA